MADHVAKAEVEIDAPPAQVWAALTDPVAIKKFMFGSDVETDWQEGSPIVWKGEYEGKSYEDKGEIVAIEPNRHLQVTHFSPLSGQDDVPENYHTLDYTLGDADGKTSLTLTQDNASSEEEAEQFAKNWQSMLDQVKQVVEED